MTHRFRGPESDMRWDVIIAEHPCTDQYDARTDFRLNVWDGLKIVDSFRDEGMDGSLDGADGRRRHKAYVQAVDDVLNMCLSSEPAPVIQDDVRLDLGELYFCITGYSERATNTSVTGNDIDFFKYQFEGPDGLYRSATIWEAPIESGYDYQMILGLTVESHDSKDYFFDLDMNGLDNPSSPVVLDAYSDAVREVLNHCQSGQ